MTFPGFEGSGSCNINPKLWGSIKNLSLPETLPAEGYCDFPSSEIFVYLLTFDYFSFFTFFDYGIKSELFISSCFTTLDPILLDSCSVLFCNIYCPIFGGMNDRLGYIYPGTTWPPYICVILYPGCYYICYALGP